MMKTLMKQTMDEIVFTDNKSRKGRILLVDDNAKILDTLAVRSWGLTFSRSAKKVAVRGRSKGRGFAGVVKRWGFSGGKDTHGCRTHRAPGSIGTNTTPGRVVRGRRLPGHMGYSRVTVRNLKVLDVRPEMNVIALVGAVPGSRNSVIEVTKLGR